MFATEVRLTTCVPDHIHIAPSGSATQLEMPYDLVASLRWWRAERGVDVHGHRQC